MKDNIIGDAIDQVHLSTLKAVVEWLEKYPVQTVIDTLKEEIERLEAK